MLDLSVIVTIVPPVFTAIIAYLIARKRNIVSERLGKAKVDAEVQTQALNIVRAVMNDMRDEFRREIEELRDKNKVLEEEIKDNRDRLKILQDQLTASDELVAILRSEITTLRKTLHLYEEEIARLKRV